LVALLPVEAAAYTHVFVWRSVEYLRVMLRAMARVPGSQRMYVKFQSAVTLSMDLLLEAFPRTPWVFLYRDLTEVSCHRRAASSLCACRSFAVRAALCMTSAAAAVALPQVIASNFRDGFGQAPCARTLRSPPAGVKALLGDAWTGGRVAPTRYCVAYLSFQRGVVLGLYRAHSGSGPGGVLLKYSQLPMGFLGEWPRRVCPPPLPLPLLLPLPLPLLLPLLLLLPLCRP
jgi:hypothetical protein